MVRVAALGLVALVLAACTGAPPRPASVTTPAASTAPAGTLANPAPTAYLLELANVDGPPVDVLIGSEVVAHLECSGYGQLIAGVGGVPALPWSITVRRTTGEVLFGPRPFTGASDRIDLLIRGTLVSFSGASRGPTAEPCSRWEVGSGPTVAPSSVRSYGIGHLIPAIDANLVPGASVGIPCPFNRVTPPVNGVLAGDQADPWGVWLVDSGGQRRNVLWPAGFTVSVVPGAMWLLDETARIVATTGDPVELPQVAPGTHTGSDQDPYLAQGLVFGTCYVERPGTAP